MRVATHKTIDRKGDLARIKPKDAEGVSWRVLWGLALSIGMGCVPALFGHEVVGRVSGLYGLGAGPHPYFQPSGHSLLTIGEEGELEIWHYEFSRLRSAVTLALEKSYGHKVSRDVSVIVGITGSEAVVWRLAPRQR